MSHVKLIKIQLIQKMKIYFMFSSLIIYFVKEEYIILDTNIFKLHHILYMTCFNA